MKYYYAIYFFDGNMITITKEEMEQIKNDLTKGMEFIQVQGNMINVKNIARIGEHESTAQMKILDKASVENGLLVEGKGDLVDERKEKETSAPARRTSRDSTSPAATTPPRSSTRSWIPGTRTPSSSAPGCRS